MTTQNQGTPYLSIIIPAYNEKDRIIPTLNQVFNFISARNVHAEVIVVDDGSTDETRSHIEKAFPTVNYLSVYSLPKNRGKGYAVKTGIQKSRGQYILFMDADSSTPITEFSELEPLLQNHDIVIGSRIKDATHDMKKPWHRKVITAVGRKVIHNFLIKDIKDTQCGFKLFRREAALEIAEQQTIDRFGFDVEILILAQKRNYKIAEVPVVWVHSSGSRFHPFWDTLRTAWDILKIKFNTSIH
jgi:dolichyl-phosphate beta-glucosyltransferase